MKRTLNSALITTLCACASLAAASSQAEERGFYVRADLGGTWMPDADLEEYFGMSGSGAKVKFDPGVRFGAAGGYQVNSWFSAEMQTGVMAANIRDISGADEVDAVFSNVPLLANVRFQLPSKCPFTPYIGAGAGMSVASLSVEEIDLGGTSIEGDEADAVFACQAFAGIRYSLNESMSLGLEYRYFTTGEPSWEGDDLSGEMRFGRIDTHAISFAFQYKF